MQPSNKQSNEVTVQDFGGILNNLAHMDANGTLSRRAIRRAAKQLKKRNKTLVKRDHKSNFCWP